MIKGLSLFSNVGIAETYFKDIGIDILVANELIKERCNMYKYFYPNCNVINGDITNISVYSEILEKAKEQNCTFLIATPPCQGMSVAGKMKKYDSRNDLIKYSINMIIDLNIEFAIIENVSNMFNTKIIDENKEITIKNFIINKLSDIYKLEFHILDTADYGVPQNRKRSITLISKNKVWNLPKKENHITVRDVISHLPSLESGEKSKIKFHNAKKHNERHIECMKHTPTGKTAFDNLIFYPKKENGERVKGFSTTYKRIDWDKPSPTITMANGSISSQNNVHPGNLKKDGTYSNARVLTLKELFILSSLPDDWTPPQWASESLIRKVIGEGIPPLFVKKIINQFLKK